MSASTTAPGFVSVEKLPAEAKVTLASSNRIQTGRLDPYANEEKWVRKTTERISSQCILSSQKMVGLRFKLDYDDRHGIVPLFTYRLQTGNAFSLASVHDVHERFTNAASMIARAYHTWATREAFLSIVQLVVGVQRAYRSHLHIGGTLK